MINRDIRNIRKEFISRFKHPHIDEDFYNQVLSEQQINLFQQLLIESDQIDHTDLFNALLHMQLSLDIHDLIDLEFSSVDRRNQTNQLQVLVGDFHSSYFYRILSEQNYLDELYHLIQSIKEINEQKMALLHSVEDDIEKQLSQVESVHCGLYYSLINLYNLTHYRTEKFGYLVNSLVYENHSIWLELLKSRHPSAEEAIIERQTNLNKMSYTGEH